MKSIKALFAPLKARIAKRTDTEYEQAMLRLFIGVGFLLYLHHGAAKNSSEWLYTSYAYLIAMAAYLSAAIGIVISIFARPQPAPVRRVLANALDVTIVTFLMLCGGEYATPLFVIYLWVTFGCGFRFGAPYLIISLVFSSAGFILVLAEGSYWLDKSTLGIGLLIGMIALSAYVLLLIRRLYEALERAEAANQAKRVFVSSVSHELRTPLNAIIGMNDLLTTTRLDTDQTEMVQSMQGASRVMLSLIEDVLDFSKIEAGKLTLEAVDFDLHLLIQNTMTVFSTQAARKGLKLGNFVTPDVPPRLNGDAHHLQQILVNLLGNAVKFTEQGEVRLIVSVLTEGPQSLRLRFAVRDTGIGISEADQKRIFESFEQANSPSTRKQRGTGLGTTIAKRLVELMAGTLRLESAPGAGSTFWFDVPFVKAEAESSETPTHFKSARTLLIGFPEHARRTMTLDLRQWEVESSYAEDVTIATARIAEAAALGQPYRLAMLYAEETSKDIAGMIAQLNERDGKYLSFILCTPRRASAEMSLAIPPEFATVVGLPAEKRLLYNALHCVVTEEETTADGHAASGVVSLADYYRNKTPTKSYKILVADDDQINRRVIAKQLEMAGHVSTLVADGEQALDALSENDFDVVILDSHMPVTNGIEATRLIRVMQAGSASVPIIMFSADATAEAIQEASDAGVDIFLAKPVEAPKLFAAIEDLTEKRARQRATVIQPITAAASAQMPLINPGALQGLEQMSQDPEFVPHLVDLFRKDSSALLIKIEAALKAHRQDELKSHIHALKGSALNLGADRLHAHCSKMGALAPRELNAASGALAAETRAIITQTHTALTDYVKARGVATA